MKEKQVSDRDFTIALCQPGESPQLVAGPGAARLVFILALVIAALLSGKAALGVPDPSSRSASKSNLLVQVLGVRSSFQAECSRVVIDLSTKIRYQVGQLQKPERVYLDLQQTTIGSRLTARRIILNDGIVDQIRLGTSQNSGVRIVLDLHEAVSYRVSSLDGPARVLIELRRLSEGGTPAESGSIRGNPRKAFRRNLRRAGSSLLSVSSEGSSSSVVSGEKPRPTTSSGPHPYGDAEKTRPDYAGTSYPRNIFLLAFSGGSSYDDNIFGNNKQRISDVDFLFGPSLSLRREGKSLSLALSYQPHFRIYQKTSEQNSLDQSLALDTTYRVSSRLAFRGRTSALYTTGIFQSSGNEEFLPGLGSPSGLNETLFTPTVRQLTLNSRIDATYQATAHDTLDLFVGQSTLDFKQQISSAGNLQNTKDRETGLVFTHRLSPHITLGANYMLEDLRFGLDSRTLVHSAFFSYAEQLSPSWSLSLFGGPQYSHLHDLVLLPLGPFTFQIPVFQASWNWAVGGTLTKQLEKSVFQFSAGHQVSNGGGLLGAVVSSSAATSVRRRLPGRWDATLSAGYANNSNLESASARGAYQSLTAAGGLEHALTERLSFRMRYEFLRQRGTGQSPLFGRFDRNLWSLELYYRFDQFVLGR